MGRYYPKFGLAAPTAISFYDSGMDTDGQSRVYLGFSEKIL